MTVPLTNCAAVSPDGRPCLLPEGHVGPHSMADRLSTGDRVPTIERVRSVGAAIAAIAFVLAGLNMINLQSESGNTVAELFDHYVGIALIGLAFLTLAWGLPRSTGTT